jgi:hypothetical protein
VGRDVDLLLEALAGEPDGLLRPELLARLRARVPAGRRDAARRSSEEVREENGRLLLAALVAEEVEPERASRPQRLVVFDLESTVRPIVKGPYREQHVFQIGAVRFGATPPRLLSSRSSSPSPPYGARRTNC